MKRADLSGHRWRRTLSGLTVLLLAVALAPALLEVHSTGREHSALDRAAEIFTGAVHPTQPAHVEASGSEDRDRCTYCILQLQSTGALRAAAALVAVVPTALVENAVAPFARSITRFHLASPRAPPAAHPAA